MNMKDQDRTTKTAASTNTVTIDLCPADFPSICAPLASELSCDMAEGAAYAADDFDGILAAWRRYAPRYVEDSIRRGSRLESAQADRQSHDRTADLLERLLAQVPHWREIRESATR